MKLLMKATCVSLAMLTLVGCGPNISASNYQAETIGRAQTVRYGTIVQAQLVQVASNNGVGTLAGVAAGATAGSMIGGSSRANILGGLAGAVVGGVAGNAIEGKIEGQQGMQYIVKLDHHAGTLSVVQGIDNPLHVGQRVMILSGSGANDRVVAAY